MNTKKIKGLMIPGDKPAKLILFYAVSCLVMTVGLSLRYYERFRSYYINDNGEYLVTGLYSCRPGEETLNAALNNIFVGSTVFLIICMIMIARNYHYFYKESKSIYLMKRLPQKAELHVRCLALPVLAALLDVALTAIMFYIYYSYYVKTIGHGYYLNIWEVFI